MGALVCEGAPHEAIALGPTALPVLTTSPSTLMLQVTVEKTTKPLRTSR